MANKKRKSKLVENPMDPLAPIQTKSSLLKSSSQFNATVYEAPKPKTKQKQTTNEESPIKLVPEDRKEIDMKKARFEIMKFGISGFDTKKKEEAKVQLAIKLGAKPPKNKYKNYKELISEKKKNQAVLEKEKNLQQLGKNVFGLSNAKGKSFERKRKKERGGLLEVYGTVKPKRRRH
ncbi:uncharacterized protein C1orf131 homolog [Ctenocephalides felis]|uniref:uncharacterized protein C1orf131 homolog n=1 Tax=Ctenocephalides felis TaxID=7515 RepID=UPI000E6E3154|nr:uncharacterized protein C1orf131 homolog [Ctenocephalides felis]